MMLRVPRLWGGGALVELLRELLAALVWRSLPLCTRLRASWIPWLWLLSWRG